MFRCNVLINSAIGICRPYDPMGAEHLCRGDSVTYSLTLKIKATEKWIEQNRGPGKLFE